jgi:hypothetical protein
MHACLHAAALAGVRTVSCNLYTQAFVLSVPVPGESLLVGQSAKLQGTFVKHLRQCIRSHAVQHGTPSPDADR